MGVARAQKGSSAFPSSATRSSLPSFSAFAALMRREAGSLLPMAICAEASCVPAKQTPTISRLFAQSVAREFFAKLSIVVMFAV